MAIPPKDLPISKELLDGVTKAKLSMNRLFEIIPFDPVPGGDLTYTHKKKDDDNE